MDWLGVSDGVFDGLIDWLLVCVPLGDSDAVQLGDMLADGVTEGDWDCVRDTVGVREPVCVKLGDCETDAVALDDELGVPDADGEPVLDGVSDCVAVLLGVGEQPRLRPIISIPAYEGVPSGPTSSANTSPTGAMGYAGSAGAKTGATASPKPLTGSPPFESLSSAQKIMDSERQTRRW